MSNRYVVECVWSGYRSSQSRPCHRTVESKKWAEQIGKISTVRFTDGTTMSVDVRECKPREKVQEIHGYDSLLSKAVALGLEGFVCVEDLQPKKDAVTT